MENLVVYKLCLGTSVIGPDFKNLHIPKEAETTLKIKEAKNKGSDSAAKSLYLPSNPTTPQFWSIQSYVFPMSLVS